MYCLPRLTQFDVQIYSYYTCTIRKTSKNTFNKAIVISLVEFNINDLFVCVRMYKKTERGKKRAQIGKKRIVCFLLFCREILLMEKDTNTISLGRTQSRERDREKHRRIGCLYLQLSSDEIRNICSIQAGRIDISFSNCDFEGYWLSFREFAIQLEFFISLEQLSSPQARALFK